MRKAKKIIENTRLDKNLLGGTAQIIIGNLRYAYLSEVLKVGSFGLPLDKVLEKLKKFLKDCKAAGVECSEVVDLFEKGLYVAAIVRIEDMNRGVATRGLEKGLPEVRRMISWTAGKLLDELRRVWGESCAGVELQEWQEALNRFGKSGSTEIEV